jgi:hypothetical protein
MAFNLIAAIQGYGGRALSIFNRVAHFNNVAQADERPFKPQASIREDGTRQFSIVARLDIEENPAKINEMMSSVSPEINFVADHDRLIWRVVVTKPEEATGNLRDDRNCDIVIELAAELNAVLLR